MELWSSLGLDKASFPCVIALVGSGGKTSLTGQLAKEGIKHNLRVAVTTTTHMKKPPRYQEVFCSIKKGTFAVFGKGCEQEKITYPGDEIYDRLYTQADLILVEADGSKGLPVKCPNDREPVIPGGTNKIIGVCGLSGLGQPLERVCHRWELLGQEGTVPVTAKGLSEILEAGYGRPLREKYPEAEFFYCMNQADTPKLEELAREILANTQSPGIITCLKREENLLYQDNENPQRPEVSQLAMIYMASGAGKRYGANKLLEPVEGDPLYLHGLRTLQRAARELDKTSPLKTRLIVVSCYQEILEQARAWGLEAVYNGDSHQGITASIHLGVEQAPLVDAYLFAVADQPWLRADSVAKLAKEFFRSEKTIACVTYREKRGNPVIFSKTYKKELQQLTGDKGGSVILKKYPQEVLTVPIGEKELQDIDTPMRKDILC